MPTSPGKGCKILVFHTGSIGDTVCAFPAIAAVRSQFPEARLDILTNAGGASLVSMGKLLRRDVYDHLVDYMGKPPLQLFKELRANRYDLIVQLPQQYAGVFSQLRDMIFFRAVGISAGFGWQKSSTLLFRKTQERYCLQKTESEVLVELLEREGMAPAKYPAYPLNITTADIEVVEDIFAEAKIRKIDPVVALVPGAKRAQNRWPLPYFREVADYLVGTGRQVIVVGGEEDTSKGSQLLDDDRGNFCGRLTPLQSAIALSACEFVVTNDTGPMHLGYSLGIPVVAIFSSRDFPGRWYPPANSGHRVFRSFDIACSICLSENCANNVCMQRIKPAEVIEYIEQRFIRTNENIHQHTPIQPD